jgi:hypothetical protein
MPLVRLKVSQHGYEIPPEIPLKQLLISEAGMDQSGADAAVRRLVKGRLVDVSFDLGEDQAARAFARNAEALGLEAKLRRDEPLSWAGSSPRPWFLRLALAVLVGFGICVWLCVTRPHAIITKVMKVVEGLVIICWFLSFALADKRLKTPAQADWESKLDSWWRLGFLVLVAVAGAIISEPILGLVLLTLAFGGIGFAFLFRMMNRH